MVGISAYNPACSYPGIRVRQPHTSHLPRAPRPATSPLVTTHCDTFPMQMAFAGALGAFPKHPSPAFLPLPQCLIQLLLFLPANVTRGSSSGHQMPLTPYSRACSALCFLLHAAILIHWFPGYLRTHHPFFYRLFPFFPAAPTGVLWLTSRTAS